MFSPQQDGNGNFPYVIHQYTMECTPWWYIPNKHRVNGVEHTWNVPVHVIIYGDIVLFIPKMYGLIHV